MKSPASIDVADAAWAAHAAGISVFPPREDGSKAPDGDWKPYQATVATSERIASWYGPHSGLGFITGAVSRCLGIHVDGMRRPIDHSFDKNPFICDAGRRVKRAVADTDDAKTCGALPP